MFHVRGSDFDLQRLSNSIYERWLIENLSWLRGDVTTSVPDEIAESITLNVFTFKEILENQVHMQHKLYLQLVQVQ